MRARFYFFMLTGVAIIAGCAQEQKKPVNLADSLKTPAMMEPFKYHKLIEVSPGQYYDILSWGRGAGNESSFLILHSDSSGKKYTTTSGDLDGVIADVYNTDMDVDGNPEILIQAKSNDSLNSANIYAYEFKDNKAQKLDFPKLVSSKKNYRGNDKFYIEDGKLIREFPSYTGSGKNAKPTGGKYKLEYGLSDNTITVNTLVKDSTIKTDNASVQEPVNKQSGEKHTKTKKAEKKHHKAEVHKKKRRRHHSDEE